MAKTVISTKHLAISKTNAQTVGAVGIASFITVFCLIAASTVWSQNQYQARVTTAKTIALKQLQNNTKAFSTLQSSYQNFVSSNPNTLGGNISGSGDNDGTNDKVILDALPSSYDFPALASSVEKILADHNYKVGSINGTDNQIAQQGNNFSPSPQAVVMPFTFSISNASYDQLQKLMTIFQSSIRPIQIDSFSLSGSSNNMQISVNAHSYFQPAKSLSIGQKVVK